MRGNAAGRAVELRGQKGQAINALSSLKCDAPGTRLVGATPSPENRYLAGIDGGLRECRHDRTRTLDHGVVLPLSQVAALLRLGLRHDSDVLHQPRGPPRLAVVGELQADEATSFRLKGIETVPRGGAIKFVGISSVLYFTGEGTSGRIGCCSWPAPRPGTSPCDRHPCARPGAPTPKTIGL